MSLFGEVNLWHGFGYGRGSEMNCLPHSVPLTSVKEEQTYGQGGTN